MNKRLFALSCVAVVWAVSSEASQPPDKQPPIELKWKLVAGQSFYQEITTETEQKMKIQAMEVAQKQRQTFWLKWTPAKEDDKTWTLEQEILGVKMDLNIGGRQISICTWDVDVRATPDPVTNLCKSLVGAKFMFTINKADMRVQKIDGREAFVEKAVKADGQLKHLLEAMLSEDTFKQWAEPLLGVIPAGGTVPNHKKWSRKTMLNLGPIGSYAADSTYAYEGANRENLLEIRETVKMTYQPPKDKGPNKMGFRIVQADLKTTEGNGAIFFDRDKGRVERSTTTLKLEGSLTIEIGGTNTQVDIWQAQKMTVKVTDKNPLK